LLCQTRAGATLTAFELISDVCVGLVEKHVPVELKIMNTIKRAPDPRGLMNPRKVLPSSGEYAIHEFMENDR
jgi:hypothetical protein